MENMKGGFQMRKCLLLSISICFCFILVACNSGKVNNAEVIIGNSNKLSQTEIEEAMSAVKVKFRDFKGCNLTKLWYDEQRSDDYDEGENTIVLLSNFDTNKAAGSQGFNTNSNYAYWMWILKRESKSDNWKIVDWGY